MVQNLYQFISPDSISTTDSLKQSISFLNARIDSLSKHTQINEIGQNFFSDAISRDLYMFSTMIVIVGLVSWAFVVGVLTRHKIMVGKETKLAIKELSDRMTHNFDNILLSLSETIYDVNRTMYFTMENDSDPDAASQFIWSMSAGAALFTYQQYGDIYTVRIWVNIARRHVKDLEVGSIASDSLAYTQSLPILEAIEDEEVSNVIKEIKMELNHVIFSKPQPPENLMEDA
jgi:hypothetical protein